MTTNRWMGSTLVILLLCSGCLSGRVVHRARVEPEGEAGALGPWRFAASGDSRNCGDVVMPAIAQDAIRHDVAFYWHLGDFRKMTAIDEDMAHQYCGNLGATDYRRDAWGDFLANQIAPFGFTPVYLGIGNHELYKDTDAATSRRDYATQFAYWLDAPPLRAQRLQDDKTADASRTYYHWRQGGVDFIYLDNANDDGFGSAQLSWLEQVLSADGPDPDVRTVVVGMHRALPNSLACGHSMNGDKDRENVGSITSGRRAYEDLLQWHQASGKPVYILASHSHFFMEGIFATPYWNRRGVLPGWIVGTAGARRYPLPEDLPPDIQAKTFVYGYLLATVAPDGHIQFEFRQLNEPDVPRAVVDRYGKDFVHECFVGNSDTGKPAPPPVSCLEQ
jgi:hypothetical protein